MAQVGHVIYKADDLEQAVSRFREQGFDVEYGKAKNPGNAVIYFSTGPYLEIISGVFMPRFVRAYLAMRGRSSRGWPVSTAITPSERSRLASLGGTRTAGSCRAAASFLTPGTCRCS